MYTVQAEGMGTFAGDAALWTAAGVGSDDPGHEMFGAADPLMYLRYVAVPHLPHQRPDHITGEVNSFFLSCQGPGRVRRHLPGGRPARRPVRRRRRGRGGGRGVAAGVHLHRAALHALPLMPVSHRRIMSLVARPPKHNVTLTCLLLPLQHCLGPDDEFLPLQDSGMAAAQEPVETSASCSYVPSDDAGDGLRQHRGARERRLT